MINDRQIKYLTISLDRTLIYAVFLFCITLIAFQPGLMSNDSFTQYGQAINMSFTDHHPPLMAIWWSFLTYIYESPATLLIFHLGMLWIALFLLAKKYKNNYIFLIGLLPFIINFAGVLWKDVGIAFSWLLAISILLSVQSNNKRRILFLLLIFYGVGIRPNALPALFPILMYFYYKEFRINYLLMGFYSLVTIILFIMFNNFITYKVYNTEKLYAGPKITMMHDLSGILKETKHNYFPEKIKKIYNVEEIVKKYNPAHVGSILWGKGENFSYRDFNKKELFIAWKNAVLNNPYEYLKLRWNHFKSLLRIGKENGYSIWKCVRVEKKNYKDIGIIYKKNLLHKIIRGYVLKFKKSFLFSGWFWLLTSFLLIFTFKRSLLSAVLGISALLYILPYFFIGQAPDFRYVYLSIILVLIGLLQLFYPNETEKKYDKDVK